MTRQRHRPSDDDKDTAFSDANDINDIDARRDDARSLIRAGDLAGMELELVNAEPEEPLLIPGTGVPAGSPFIRRRPRPLIMRLAICAVVATTLLTGLFSFVPLGSANGEPLTPFEAVSGSVILHQGVSYHWYVAEAGDNIESVAAKFHVQIGGIYELNYLVAGQDLQLGQPYKIPDDPYYGASYMPPQPNYASARTGTMAFGSDWWNSYIDHPLPGAPCAPYGGNNPLGYQLHSPNWGSIWKRGWGPYHNGEDLDAPAGNPIRAAQYGQVLFAGWTPTGFGFAIRIYHCNGLSTLYGHMAKLLVHAGDIVHPGMIIGLEGSTGESTGPHLHFSVVLGPQTFVDPMPYYGGSIAALTQGG